MSFFDDMFRERDEKLGANQDRINKLQARVKSIHRVSVDEATIRQKLLDDPNCSALSIDYLLDLVSQLYLVELELSDIGIAPLLLSATTQDNGEDQAPYLEEYFENDGLTAFAGKRDLLGNPDESCTSPGRVCFYMHFFDENTDLLVHEKRLTLPPITPMPEGLPSLMPYQPPD